jgi:hypothetical protein
VILACLACAVLGASSAAVVVAARQPPTLGDEGVELTAAVLAFEFSDEREVTLDVELPTVQNSYSSAGGTVTSSNCEPGVELRTGESVFHVDGSGAVLLASDVPLWRSLSVGSRGEDAAAFNAALRDVGTDVVGDDISRASLDAAAELLGRVDPIDMVEPDSFVWVPRGAQVVDCLVDVGTRIAHADTIMRVSSRPVGTLRNLPPALVNGDRQIRTEGVTLRVGADGGVSDPALAAVPAVQAALEQDLRALRIDGVLALAEPVSVSAVPASAVVVESPTSGCVYLESGSLRGEVVGSQLGQTFLRFDGSAPQEVLSTPPTSSCPST